MALQRMSIQSVVVGSGPVASLVILVPRRDTKDDSLVQLPIKIGRVEALSIGMGIDNKRNERPMTHDLMKNVIESLNSSLVDVVIYDVRGTTFYAQLHLTNASSQPVYVDARPSDAIALAVRMNKPIYADDRVLRTASMPDFASVERDAREAEVEAFHDFIEGLSPEDFDAGGTPA